jgi:hypothetical protein
MSREREREIKSERTQERLINKEGEPKIEIDRERYNSRERDNPREI